MNKIIVIAAAFLCITLASLFGPFGDHAAIDEDSALVGPFNVTRVVDGDTILIDINGTEEKVRLIGIDTPESVHSDESRNVPYGKIAAEFTESELEGEDVFLELDIETRDQYKRLLAYVYHDGEMFNNLLLAEGHAQIYTFPPNVKYIDLFTETQEKARNAKKGIWANDDGLLE